MKINKNAYIIDLPEKFNMSPPFNVADLKKYCPPDQPELNQLRTTDLGEGSLDVGPLLAEGSNCAQCANRGTITTH